MRLESQEYGSKRSRSWLSLMDRLRTVWGDWPRVRIQEAEILAYWVCLYGILLHGPVENYMRQVSQECGSKRPRSWYSVIDRLRTVWGKWAKSADPRDRDPHLLCSSLRYDMPWIGWGPYEVGGPRVQIQEAVILTGHGWLRDIY